MPSTPIANRQSQIANGRGGFTLVELLVVIAILAVLISILLPTLSRVQTRAKELRSLSNLRQLLTAYTAYHTDNKGAVPWGYPPPTVNGVPVTAFDPVSGNTFSSVVATRYPWRLIKYLSNVWPIVNSHHDTPELIQKTDSFSTAFNKAYILSLEPTYGINATYVGGIQGPLFQGFTGPTGDTPNTGKHVVFKANEVRRPHDLIIFSDVRSYNAGMTASGFHYLTPPRARGQQWKVTNGKIERLNTSQITGIPQGWYSNRITTGFFDGHVASLLPADLEDMRLWSHKATSPTYDYAP